MYKYLCFILLPAQLYATNYYLASNGSDAASGTSITSAWKSIHQLNLNFKNIRSGDSILFRRGDVFYGSIVVQQSGTEGNPVVIGAYGYGSKPIVTGFTIIDNWEIKSKGVWQAIVPAAKPAVNLVVKDNMIQQVGRYPNANAPNGGYMVYNAVGGSREKQGIASITSENIFTQNWSGAEVVIKKKRWDIERDTVTAQDGNTITYRQPYKGNIYPGIKGFGFFFQRHPRTLDQPGEWFFDAKSHCLQMYFGIATPHTSIIKISTVDTLINIGSHTNIVVTNLAFEGANEAAIYSNYSSNCTTSFCDFNFMGRDAVTNWQTSNALVEHCTVSNALGSGIFIRNSGSGGYNQSTVKYCQVKNICLFAGMEVTGDASGRTGIAAMGGNGVNILYNRADSCGYAGIEWQGNDVLLYGNVISNCLRVRDDGGGIYSYAGNGSNPKSYHNRIIRKNLVFNCKGNSDGTNKKDPSARGIYCDEGNSDIVIDSNSIAWCSGAAIYCNSVTDIVVKENTTFENGMAFSFQRFENAKPLRNINISSNYFYPYTAAYANSQLDKPDLNFENDIKAIGSIDNNFYLLDAGPSPFSFTTMKTGNKEYKQFSASFNDWQVQLGFDKNSAGRFVNKNLLRFEYNDTAVPKLILLKKKYKNLKGMLYADKITLPAFTSVLLVAADQ